MGVSIVITSGKGGVGKTTTTANLGTALAALGNKVVVVDGDTGLRNLDVLMGLENRIVYTIVDAIEGRCRLKQALIKDKRFQNLFLLPTAQTKDKDDIVIGKLDAKGLEDHGVIVNRLNYEMTRRGDMLDVSDIIETLSVKLVGVVPDDKNITVSTNKGEPIVLEEKAYAGEAFRNIAKRITGEDVPIMDLQENSAGFFGSLKKLFGRK